MDGSERYDAAGNLVVFGGWRIREPYTDVKQFRVGDIVRLQWNGSIGVPHELNFHLAKVIGVGRKRLAVIPEGWSTVYHPHADQICEVVARQEVVDALESSRNQT